jgi:hypothetical protein
VIYLTQERRDELERDKLVCRLSQATVAELRGVDLSALRKFVASLDKARKS